MLEYKQLYDECEIDAQCNGTSEEVVCKEKYHRKMCMCNTGYKYMEVNGNWKCVKGKLFPRLIFILLYHVYQISEKQKKNRFTLGLVNFFYFIYFY